MWFVFAFSKSFDSCVELSWFQTIGLFTHSLLKCFVVGTKRAKKGKVDLGIRHFRSTRRSMVLSVGKEFGKFIDMCLHCYCRKFAKRVELCLGFGMKCVGDCAVFFFEARLNLRGEREIVDFDEFRAFEATEERFSSKRMTSNPG
jgi:hypothetical protein